MDKMRIIIILNELFTDVFFYGTYPHTHTHIKQCEHLIEKQKIHKKK